MPNDNSTAYQSDQKSRVRVGSSSPSSPTQIVGAPESHFPDARSRFYYYLYNGFKKPPRYTSTVPGRNNISFVYNDSFNTLPNYSSTDFDPSYKRNPATTSSDVSYEAPPPSAPLPEQDNYSKDDISYAKQYGTVPPTPPASSSDGSLSISDMIDPKRIFDGFLNPTAENNPYWPGVPYAPDYVPPSGSGDSNSKGWDKGDWLRLGLTLLGAGLSGASNLFGKDGPFSNSSSPYGRGYSGIVPQIPMRFNFALQNQLLPYLQALSQRAATPFVGSSSSSRSRS